MSATIRRRPIVTEHQLPAELHPVLQRVYAARGVTRAAELELALKGMLDYRKLKGIDEGCALLVEAITAGRRILVIGDYDADGATSTALAVQALRQMGAAWVDFMVPNRFEYGYGLSPEIVAAAQSRQPDLLVTVDNGIASVAGVRAARQAGMQVLVTDHHLPGDELPRADAIINPNQPGCTFDSKNIAGCGVVFYLMCALRAVLRARGWFNGALAEPNLGDLLDLVALGTVADVVTLDYNNRILVQQGLKRIRAGRCRPGIRHLAEVAGRKLVSLKAADFGFALGPRLNAAGRLDDMSIGIELLLTDDEERARMLASELDQLNRDRRKIETEMKQQALAILDHLQPLDPQSLPSGICLYQSDWHQGVIGILAARIKERFHRPVIVFAAAGDGEIKGSARSIPGFHLRDALDRVDKANPGLIQKFGGHAMAAGLSIDEADFERFTQAFTQVTDRLLDAELLQAQVLTDGALTPTDFSMELANALADGGPWGQQFPEPCFDGDFVILQQRLVGEHHLKLVLQLPGTMTYLDAIAFNVDRNIWPDPTLARVHVAYRLEVNEFRGQRKLQLVVEQLQPL